MKKTETIKKNFEFKKMLHKGKYIPGKFIVVYYLENKEEKNKIGIAISKKVGKSVVRNRIKRLIRESYYALEKDLKKQYSIVFMWRKNQNPDLITFWDIKNDIESTLKRVGVL